MRTELDSIMRAVAAEAIAEGEVRRARWERESVCVCV